MAAESGRGDAHVSPNPGERIVHVYDGIQEADNDLPRWWLGIFYLSIAFSLVYWFVYHQLGAAKLPLELYADELAAQAAQSGGVSEAMLVAMAGDPGAVEAGKAAWDKNCVACHEADGRGKIGPNLTDAHWIYGGSAEAIWKTVDKGTPAGMPGWGGLLGPKETQRVVAYVLTLRGKNLPGKEPQGEVWDPAAGGATAAP